MKLIPLCLLITKPGGFVYNENNRPKTEPWGMPNKSLQRINKVEPSRTMHGLCSGILYMTSNVASPGMPKLSLHHFCTTTHYPPQLNTIGTMLSTAKPYIRCI